MLLTIEECDITFPADAAVPEDDEDEETREGEA